MRSSLKIIVLIICIISLFGCTSRDPVVEYKEAIRKTNEIKKGQMSFELSIESEYNIDGLNEEKIKKLNYFRKIDISTYSTYDSQQNRVIARNYYNFGGIGFDSTLYIDKDKCYMKMPLVGKYLDIGGGNNSKGIDSIETVTQGMMESINNKWLEILEKNDVITGEKTILNVRDGEVKVTRFSINLTENQIKAFLKNVLEAIADNKELFYEFGWDETGVPIEFEKAVYELNERMKRSKVAEFKYDCYIDVDGYIIQEDGKLVLEFENPKPGEARISECSFLIKNWSIEKPQKFSFPVITEDNILNREDIDQSVPFMFEDMINSNKKEEK